MVSEGKARLFKNTQGRYMIYLPVDLAQDSMFPFKVEDSKYVRIGFKQGEERIIITEWIESEEAAKKHEES